MDAIMTMKKNMPKLIALLGVVILLIAFVEIGNYLLPVTTSDLLPAPTSGSVTVTDEIGDTWHPTENPEVFPEELPDLPFLDIVKATVEKNETSLTVTIEVNGDIPNKTEDADTTYAYDFREFMSLELTGDKWTPILGHPEQYYAVDYSGNDFPGSYVIDHEGRTVRIFLDLKFLRAQGYKTDITSDTFTWTAGTVYWGRQIAVPWDSTSSAYFPDFLSFYRPLIHILILVIIVIGGVIWGIKAFIWKH